MDTHWYKTFFDGIAVDCWRKCVAQEQTRAEAELLFQELACPPGARLLDVPCGHGRLTVELAEHGYRMTGVDISESEIREAGLRAAPAGRTIEWLCADMCDIQWESEFDGGFCVGNSFGYLEFDDMRRFLQNVARALKPGARFVVQTNMAAESIIPAFQERNWYRFDDILFAIANEYRAESSRIFTECTFVRKAQAEKKRFSHAVYTAAEIQRMLKEAGLKTISVYGSLNRQPFKLGAPSLYLVTQKKA